MFKIYVWSSFTIIFPCSIIILRVECVHFICFLLGFVICTVKHVVSRNDSSSYPSQSFLSHRCNIYSFTRRIFALFYFVKCFKFVKNRILKRISLLYNVNPLERCDVCRTCSNLLALATFVCTEITGRVKLLVK